MTEKEIQNFFRRRDEDAEDRDEMNRVKGQLLRRMTKVMKKILPPESATKIPEKLILRNIGASVVMDVVLLKGETFHRLIVDPKGVVIGRDTHPQNIPSFQTESVFAVRIRSGFFGKIGLSRWRSIYD
jgi:hypothetical protein